MTIRDYMSNEATGVQRMTITFHTGKPEKSSKGRSDLLGLDVKG